MMLFPELPADLAAASDDELAQLRQQHLEAVTKISTGDTEFLGDLAADQIVAEMQSGVEQLEQIKDELASRAEAQKNFEDEVAQLASRAEALAAETDEPAAEEGPAVEAVAEEPAEEVVEVEVEIEEPTAEAESEKVEEPEPVAAAATKRLARPPAASRAHRPQPAAEANGARLVASAGISGFRPGEEITPDRLGELLSEGTRQFTARSGVEERVVLASARFDYPEERKLSSRDIDGNMEKIRAVTSPPALVAAGGLCAPLTPLYDLPVLSDADRPVWDALPKFQADRGGITFPTPIGLSTSRGAITRVTAAEDEAGGSSAVKGCLVIDCDDFQSATVDAIAGCVEFSNMGARAWPERVQTIGTLVQVAHAEEGELGLLNAIAAGSTATTGAEEYGATASLLRHMLLAAAGYRDRHRMRSDRVLRALLPSYAVDLLVADIVSGQYDRFSRDQNGVEQLLRSYRIAPSFYMDGTDFATTQAAAALNDWPSTVVWFLYAEGTWIGLDMGRLDLGIVRDSELNSRNVYRTFFETFEGIAKTGVESIQVTSTVCPNGTVAATSTPISC